MKLKHVLFICLAALAFTACESGDITLTELHDDGSFTQHIAAADGIDVDDFVIQGCFEQLGLGCTQDTYGDPTGVGVPINASYMQPLCTQTFRDGHIWEHKCTPFDLDDDRHGCWPNTECVATHTNHGEDPTILKPLDNIGSASASVFRRAAASHGVDVSKKQARRVIRGNR